MQHQRIDDRFTEGVWYDMMTGDYLQFEQREDYDVALFDTEGDEIDVIAIEDFTPEDFYRVPEEAVEDPVNYLTRKIDWLRVESTEPGNRLSVRESIGVGYAQEKTEIVEV